MGFFATFWAKLNQLSAAYVGDNLAAVAAAIEPALVTMAVLYVMVWGYLQMTGRIEQPLLMGLKRILTLALVLVVSVRLWLYNEVVVDLFYTAPAQLAAAIVKAPDPVQTIDAIWESGGAVADYLWHNGVVFSSDFGFFIAGVVVWVIVGLLCVYTLFLIALSHIALTVLLALGPFFFAMLLFDQTRRMFDAWLAQLTNYALITILTIMVAALLLQVVVSYAQQTAALGSRMTTVDALDMVLACVLVFLFMRQIMPIAAGLAGGTALNTFGTVSGAINWSKRAGVGVMQKSGRIALARLFGRN